MDRTLGTEMPEPAVVMYLFRCKQGHAWGATHRSPCPVCHDEAT